VKKIYITILIFFSIVLIVAPSVRASKILIPMDLTQSDHLKAYGVAYWCLEYNVNVEWLLNYRDGSFLTDDLTQIEEVCRLKGVTYEKISAADEALIKNSIEERNMEVVLLEKAPKIAIYAPPSRSNEPWDDAVNLALEYAEISFEVIWDPDVILG